MEIKKVESSDGVFTNYVFKTIPLVFDESMSYYETLSALMGAISGYDTVINNNADVVAELQTYVENYFNNLDVTTEVNAKLDELVNDGTLATLINDYLAAKTSEINESITSQNNSIASAITEQDNKIESAITTQTNAINTAIASQNSTISNAITQQNNTIAGYSDTLDSKQNKILYGTADPTSDVGVNGDIYIVYGE